MTEKEKALLRKIRTQTIMIGQLNERIKRESTEKLRSLTLDGMPRGSSAHAGLDVQAARWDALERIYERENEERRKTESQVRRIMEGMKPEQYVFCTLYYIGGLSVEAAAEAMARSERQIWRIKKEIEA